MRGFGGTDLLPALLRKVRPPLPSLLSTACVTEAS